MSAINDAAELSHEAISLRKFTAFPEMTFLSRFIVARGGI
jgi:hypothetical protein